MWSISVPVVARSLDHGPVFLSPYNTPQHVRGSPGKTVLKKSVGKSVRMSAALSGCLVLLRLVKLVALLTELLLLDYARAKKAAKEENWNSWRRKQEKVGEGFRAIRTRYCLVSFGSRLTYRVLPMRKMDEALEVLQANWLK
jgi:hypothetical protein